MGVNSTAVLVFGVDLSNSEMWNLFDEDNSNYDTVEELIASTTHYCVLDEEFYGIPLLCKWVTKDDSLYKHVSSRIEKLGESLLPLEEEANRVKDTFGYELKHIIPEIKQLKPQWYLIGAYT